MPKKLFNLFQNEINLTTGIINSCMQSALFSHLKACKNMKESRSGFLMKLAALLIYYISLLMYGKVLNQ